MRARRIWAMILAGDIGGTNARLASFEATQGHVTLRSLKRRFPVMHLPVSVTLSARSSRPITCVLRTPVLGLLGRYSMVAVRPSTWRGWWMHSNLPNNLAWPRYGSLTISKPMLTALRLIAPEDFVILNEGTPDAEGNAAVIAAGTGLGEAGLYWDGKQHLAVCLRGRPCQFCAR